MTESALDPIERERRDYLRFRAALLDHSLPVALIDLDRLELCAQRVLAEARELPVRLDASAIRCPGLLRHLQQHHERFKGLICHNAREAVWLSQQGFDDVIVARPTIDAVELRAVTRAIAAGRNISLVVDDAAQIDLAEDAARIAGVRIALLLDINLRRYVGRTQNRHRSALQQPLQAVRLANRIRSSGGHVLLRGVHSYETSVESPRLANGGLLERYRHQRARLHSRRAAHGRQAFVAALHAAGFEPELVIAAGVRVADAAEDRLVTQAGVGSSLIPRSDQAETLLLAMPVLRIVEPELVVCGGTRYPLRPCLPGGIRLLSKRRAHAGGTLALRLSPGDQLGLGRPVLFAGKRICDITEQCEHLLALRGNRVVAEWATYRGEHQCFL